MRSATRRAILCTAVAAALSAAADAQAVRLNADGLGQALIFPYYTVQSAAGGALNTYLSVVNHGPDAKALRVRFHEGRMGAEVANFNLFLSPNDVWTAALVPTADGTRLLTVDRSCTEPKFAQASPDAPSTLDFGAFSYSGLHDDGAGSGLDRTREGYFEVIEMATLTGAAALAVTQTAATQAPANCAYVQGPGAVPVAAPSGDLSGSFTLINVANGMEFSTNAVALDKLTTRPFFRPSSDPYPDWNASEIDPVSVVVANGSVYRSVWARPVDAVSAVLMATGIEGEYVLDVATNSNTDFVATFPTRQYYVSADGMLRPPFSGPSRWKPLCNDSGTALGTPTSITSFDRDARSATVAQPDFATHPAGYNPAFNDVCSATFVFDVINRRPDGGVDGPANSPTRVLGSQIRGIGMGHAAVVNSFEHGWLRLTGLSSSITSLPSSTRLDLATGAVTTGAQAYDGLPMVGFSARTFVNGTLACGAGSCQGNYGAAFPFKYIRTISP